MAKSNTVGEQLREWREAAGLDQDQIAAAARAIGLTSWNRATVTAIELGRRELTLSEFLTLRNRPLQQSELGRLFNQATSTRPINAEVAEQLDAETKAARKLGVSPKLIVATAKRLWGRTLTEERDRVVQARLQMENLAANTWKARTPDVVSPKGASRQAHRGHATRELVAVLASSVRGKGRT